MEHFDAVGKWRTVDGATPVDASGAMVEFPELAGRFDGAVDLARRIARSAQLRSCFVQQLYRYAVGRRVQDSDEETLAWLRRMLDDAQHDMRELAVALAASPPQQFRLVDAGGAP
jgi:hypothetical protein